MQKEKRLTTTTKWPLMIHTLAARNSHRSTTIPCPYNCTHFRLGVPNTVRVHLMLRTRLFTDALSKQSRLAGTRLVGSFEREPEVKAIYKFQGLLVLTVWNLTKNRRPNRAEIGGHIKDEVTEMLQEGFPFP